MAAYFKRRAEAPKKEYRRYHGIILTADDEDIVNPLLHAALVGFADTYSENRGSRRF